MHLFVSAGEPSGDLHGSNLIQSLRAQNPSLQVSGFGGTRMQNAGANLLYPLTDLAVMWVGRVLANLPTFFRLADEAERYFLRKRPDAVVLIDYPGFHWHIAKRAKAARIPVYYFVPPQLWAWASWRVRKMQRTVHTVLTALPFEDQWYRRRGVRTHYVGHPYFDELRAQRLDAEFLVQQRASRRPIIGLLPGSRTQEVTANLPDMILAAQKVAATCPEVRFLVASFHTRHGVLATKMLENSGLDTEVHVGRTPEIIELSHACLAVSGSVGLEMLTRTKPSVILYKITPFARQVSQHFIKCRFISLVNLLAGKEIFPEFLTSIDQTDAISQHLIRYLTEPAEHRQAVLELEQLRDRVAIPGACERAAEFLTQQLTPMRQVA